MYTQRPPVRRPAPTAGQKISSILFGPPNERSLKRMLGTVVGVVVLLVLLAGIVRTTMEGRYYSNIAWKPYAPADGSFKVKFPGDPQSSTESRNINGDMWQVISLESRHRNHQYFVEYVDLHMVIPKSKSREIMERFFNGVLSETGGKSVSTEEATLARNPAMNFVAVIPARRKGSTTDDTKARMRGILALRNSRLFIVWTASGLGDPHKKDLQQFMESFEIPPPVETSFAF